MKHAKERPAAPKKERVRSSLAVRILVLILLIAAGLQLWHLSSQVGQAQQEKEKLAAQVAQAEQENEALRQDIAEGPTTEKMKELAREEGYVGQGEYLFELHGLDGEESPVKKP